MKFWPTVLILLIIATYTPISILTAETPTSIGGGDDFAKEKVDPVKLLIGDWKHISYTDNKNNREIPLGMIGVEVTTSFAKDGTYQKTTNSQQNSNETGYWEYNKEKQTIVLKSDKSEDGISYSIDKLDENSMVLKVVNRTTKMRKIKL